MKITRFILISVFTLCSMPSWGIVNVESMLSKGKANKINAGVHVGYSEIDSKASFKRFTGGATLRFLTEPKLEDGIVEFKDRIFANYKLDRSEKDDQKVADNSFFHLRYTRLIWENVGPELFIQKEKNIFNSLESRELFGGAFRFSLRKKRFRSIFGLGLMEEKEVVDLAQRIITDTTRVSAHLNFIYHLKDKGVSLTLLSYYQPSIKRTSDFRLLTTGGVNVDLSESIRLAFEYSMTQDSLPPVGIPKRTSVTKQRLTYSF